MTRVNTSMSLSICAAIMSGVPLPGLNPMALKARTEAAELSELVTNSLQEYEDLALRLTRDPMLLARMKAKLAENKSSCAAFDTPRYTRHLESAYAVMHERSRLGLAPESFAIPEGA